MALSTRLYGHHSQLNIDFNLTVCLAIVARKMKRKLATAFAKISNILHKFVRNKEIIDTLMILDMIGLWAKYAFNI